ncbi:ABC transporter [Austwickia sp. TVS 96-490-7B]|uniref:ABC transporter n=1 Tax=Austwickia sp. TVS 96-490-7B TaxID=2830843 RepID=UPI001C575F80|nr:ABC transporter [Austwickia sp. TVS 96-490-7B]
MTHTVTTDALVAAVRALRAEINRVQLPLHIDGATHARRELAAVRAQLDDYLVPRLTHVDAPVLAVVGGSTGSGKSTLVNSLACSLVSRAGVLRPTTRAPVLVHHPEEAFWFVGSRILPGLTRDRTGDPDHQDPSSIRLVAADALPQGVALIDAPDIDSVVESNRDLARQLLSAADLWLFVTSASRYADAVPWSFLHQAAERGTSVAIVLDRVPAEALVAVRDHLSGMLATEGLRSVPIFSLTESPLGEGGMLPERQLEPLRDWLTTLATDSRAKNVVVRRTLSGALDALDVHVHALADASSAQVQTVEQLQAIVQSSYGEATRRVQEEAADGSLLRGEVLARWQEYVGAGDLVRSFEAAVGRLRDRVTTALGGRPAPTAELGVALQEGLHQLILAHAEAAALQVSRRWSSVPGGEDIVTDHPDLDRLPADLPAHVTELIQQWRTDILDLVRAEGKDRRTTARVLSFGVNGVGVVLMLAVFSHTVGVSGAELGIAGGSALLAQKILEAIFGDQAVRELTTEAHQRLLERVSALYAREQDRILAALTTIDLATDTPERLLKAAAAVKAQR